MEICVDVYYRLLKICNVSDMLMWSPIACFFVFGAESIQCLEVKTDIWLEYQIPGSFWVAFKHCFPYFIIIRGKFCLISGCWEKHPCVITHPYGYSFTAFCYSLVRISWSHWKVIQVQKIQTSLVQDVHVVFTILKCWRSNSWLPPPSFITSSCSHCVLWYGSGSSI